MSTLKTEKIILIKLSIKKKDDGSIRDIWVSGTSYPADYLYPASPEVLGILDSINGFGASMGRAMTISNDGSIGLKAVRGSLDYNKRIYDLLDDYSFINQPIIGYSFQKIREQQAPNADDLAQEFDGKISDYKIDTKSQELNLEINSNNISTEIVNKKYDTSNLSLGSYTVENLFSNTESYAPIAFGAEVIYRLTPLLNLKQNNYGGKLTSMATVYGQLSKYGNFGGGANLHAFDLFTSVDSSEIERCDQFTGSLHSGTGALNTIGQKSSTYDRDYYIALQLDSNAFDTFNVGAFFKLIHSVTIGTTYNTTTPNGTIDLNLFYLNESFIEIANATSSVNKFTRREQNTSANFTRFDFEKPVLIDVRRLVFARISQTGTTPAAPGDYIIRFNSGTNASFPALLITPIIWVSRERSGTNNNAQNIEGIFGINPNNSSINNYEITNINTSNVFYKQLTIPETANTIFIQRENSNPRDLLVTARGIVETSPATIRTPNGSPIQLPYDILRFLYYLQNGNSLTNWNSNFYYSQVTLNTLVLNGIEENAISYRELMINILEASSSVLIKRRNSNYIMWTYGTPFLSDAFADRSERVVGIITERDCNLQSIESLGVQNIVNSATLQYDQNLLPIKDSVSRDSAYKKSRTLEDAESISLYGKKELPVAFQTNKWIKDDATADLYLSYKIEQQSSERFKIVIEVPFWGKINIAASYWSGSIVYYKDIELWQLFNFNHIDMPSKSGTQSANNASTFQGGDDWAIGDVIRNAKNYICRVTKKQPLYNLEKEPIIRFELITLGKNEKY